MILRSIYHSLYISLFFCCLFSIRAETTHEQPVTGRVRGKVIDENTKKPLPAANIMIDDTELGTASDEQGEYEIKHVPSGIHQLRFMMMGYKNRVVSNVVVNPNKTTWQTIELTPTVLETEGVTVTAGFFHSAKDAVVSSRSVDFEEIRMDPGSAMDIQRVIQALPAVVSGSDRTNEIIVRGGMPGENLFVMDHIDIPNPNHFGDQGTGGGPINMINAHMVRRVDFYAGAFPARYGDKASSVMDISLREGDREKVTGHAFMGMSGAGGIVEGPFSGGKGTFILSGQKSFLDLIISSVGLTAVPQYYSLQGKVSYYINANDRIRLNGIYGDDRIHIEDSEDDAYSQGAENVRASSHQSAVGITWRHLFGGKGFSRVTISQTANHWNTDVYRDNGTRYYRNLSDETERTLKADITWQSSKTLEWSTGGYLKQVPFNIFQWSESDTLSVYDWPDHPNQFLKDTLYYEFLQRADQTTYKAAAFIQAKYQLLSRLSTTFGLRLDYFDYTQKYALDPRLGFSFDLSTVTSINLALGRHSQSPSYIEISGYPSNRNLDFKKTQQIIVGVEHLFREDIRGTLEVFYKDYSDVPLGISGLTSDPYDHSKGRLVNKGQGFARGIEFFLQKKYSRHLFYTLSYSYSQSKGYDPRTNVTYNWDYDYRHVFTLVSGFLYDFRKHDWYQKLKKNLFYNLIDWALPIADQVEIGVRWRYLGGRPYTKLTYMDRYHVWTTLPETPFNTLRYPAYHRLDLRIDQRYMFKKWNMVTYFDIMNIYGRDNIWAYRYCSDGKKKTILQWQIFPVGGITVEF
ncbi:TonB-dependent receptor [bacterium]|nr:TonB-dependent receptor [bacterium]